MFFLQMLLLLYALRYQGHMRYGDFVTKVVSTKGNGELFLAGLVSPGFVDSFDTCYF
jgi:hypothetical protein